MQLVIFPFEEPFYPLARLYTWSFGASAGGDRRANNFPQRIRRAKWPRSGEDLDRTPSPGSRAEEIRDNLPEILSAARRFIDPEDGDPRWFHQPAPAAGSGEAED